MSLGNYERYRERSSSEGLGLDDNDILNGPVARTCSDISNLLHDIHAVDDLAKHSVLAVQVRGGSKTDEELTAVGARTAVGHGQDTGASVLERAVELVLELATPDGLSATAGACGVAALEHEAGDDAVEDDAVVLACVGEACKVLTCLCGALR